MANALSLKKARADLYRIADSILEKVTRRAFEYTAELVRRGYCPLIFPEGRRTRDGKLQGFRPGIGMTAGPLRIPVVPVEKIIDNMKSP